MGTILRVATINILKDGSRWAERRALLIRGLDTLDADLIALQEVRDPLATGTADWIAGELGGYSVHACPKTGRGSKREGGRRPSAALPVEWHEPLDPREPAADGADRPGSRRRSPGRPRQRPLFLARRRPLGAGPAGGGASSTDLKPLDPATAVLSCGDFNAAPGSPPIALMRRFFTSAHEAHHGHEPEYTCPTPLRNGGPVRRRVAGGLFGLANSLPGGPWRWALDYIFVGPGIRVVECDVFLDRPATDDPTLYASDHLGLFATVEIAGPDAGDASP